jgi:hypothetical protein
MGLQSHRAAMVAGILLSAVRCLAQIPRPVLDPRQYVLAEVYDLAPALRSEWEQGRYSTNEIWIGLGGYHFRDLNAVERGVVNLPLSDGILFHGDIRNDRDPDLQVRRLVVDLWGRVLPWLWLGPSGAPAIPGSQKENYAVGASGLIGDFKRERYLLARLVLDATFYNRLNRDGGHRGSPTFHPELEGRWSAGEWSLYSRLDLISLTETVFPDTRPITYQASAKGEYEFHLRFARPRWEGDLRFDLLGLRDDRDENGQAITHRRLQMATRVEGLLRPNGDWPLAVRFGLRLFTQSLHARGADAYQLFRVEPGFRVGAVWEGATNQAELGYVAGFPHFALTLNGVQEDLPRYEDSAYAQWQYSPTQRFHLRAQVVCRLAHLGFGGASVLLFAQF